MTWTLTLYSKPDCSLCDEAKRAVAEFQSECAFKLEVVDITKDPDLWQRYRYEIPVLHIDGQEATRHHVSLKKLRVLRKRWEQGESLPRPNARVFGAN